MSSRDIARLVYLNKVLLSIIYLRFWQFYFLSMLIVGLISAQKT